MTQPGTGLPSPTPGHASHSRDTTSRKPCGIDVQREGPGVRQVGAAWFSLVMELSKTPITVT